VYLGFSYDLARGMQDELLRWADEQKKIKRVRAREAAEKVFPRPPLDDVRPTGEVLAERRAS
jgi:DNA polymerase II large subunit